MSKSLNKVMLIGNLGSDPEIRMTPNGSKVAKFSLATSRTWEGKDGSKQEKTDWHRCTVFGKLADVVEQWIHKGDRLYVEGRIEYFQTGEDDLKKYFTDIIVQEFVMLGGSAENKKVAPSSKPDLPF